MIRSAGLKDAFKRLQTFHPAQSDCVLPQPKSFTLCLLVDALRPDYLTHAPFLRGLAAESGTGFFREGFGFVPRQAYFGGLKTEEYGFTNMFCFDPGQSPFASARYLSDAPTRALRPEMPDARAQVDRLAQDRMTPFAKAYASSMQIPLPYAPYFDVVEKRAPWDRKVGYRSCFEILDELAIPWRQCMWPDTNRLPDHSDAGIVSQILQDLGPEHRLACVHLQELDSLGHAYGPNSAKLQQGVAATDRECRRLIGGLRERYGHVNIILFGDHGMVNVTRALDLTPVLEATGLRFGADYAYFLDSTMARFWFFHAAARSRLEAALREVPGGRLLEEDDLERFGLARCDHRNGERYFLADPGVLILPNFFQPSGSPIPGMHGYDPDCPDNLGFFLLHDPGRPELAGSRLGKVDPHGLFPIVLTSVGLDAGRYGRRGVPTPVHAPRPPGRYTRHEAVAAEAVVRAHLDRVLQSIAQRVGPVEAVVLTGSFGRGEGGVYRDEAGRYLPVNDYDLTVVDARNLSAPLAGLGEELARELDIDFVDLSWSDGRWEQWPLTIANYDLKYGSQVIAGNPAILDRLPAYASADLPPEEIVRLLLNRTAGLLIGLRGEFLAGRPPTDRERRFLTNQIAKALMALGDWHLFQWRGYDSSYARRRQRFASLAPGAGVGTGIAGRICQAYDFKCRPDYTWFADGVNEIRQIYAELEAAWRQSIQCLTGRPAKILEEAAAHYRARMGPTSPRHAVMAALPLVLQAAVAGTSGDGFAQTIPQLPFLTGLPPEAKFTPENWEWVRAAAVQAWFAECH
jgi:hypothetical protein